MWAYARRVQPQPMVEKALRVKAARRRNYSSIRVLHRRQCAAAWTAAYASTRHQHHHRRRHHTGLHASLQAEVVLAHGGGALSSRTDNSMLYHRRLASRLCIEQRPPGLLCTGEHDERCCWSGEYRSAAVRAAWAASTATNVATDTTAWPPFQPRRERNLLLPREHEQHQRNAPRHANMQRQAARRFWRVQYVVCRAGRVRSEAAE